MADDALSARAARSSVVRALSAELGHDLQGPLNLFRLVTDRLTRGEALDSEDITLLAEELERLSGLSARLRSLARTSLERRPCTPAELVQLALSAPPRVDAVAPRALQLELNAASDVTLSCDGQLLALALRELLDNALEAMATRAGVRFVTQETPGFCVWDDGPGFELGSDCSLPWGATTKPGAAGLGLTLALRAARAHGFQLELRRAGSLTEAWLLIPARELSEPATRVTP